MSRGVAGSKGWNRQGSASYCGSDRPSLQPSGRVAPGSDLIFKESDGVLRTELYETILVELGSKLMVTENNPEARGRCLSGSGQQQPWRILGRFILPKHSWIREIFKIELSPEEIIPVLASLKILRHKFPTGHQLFYFDSTFWVLIQGRIQRGFDESLKRAPMCLKRNNK